MYRNNGKTPLYIVKRRDAEVYHCGSYSSTTPKLYTIGHAKVACRKLNKYLDNSAEKNKPVASFAEWRGVNHYREAMKDEDALNLYDDYVTYKTGGPWIVAQLQLAASEIEID